MNWWIIGIAAVLAVIFFLIPKKKEVKSDGE